MSPNEPVNGNGSVSATEDQPTLRLIVADTQAIFRVGVRKVLALEEDIRVVAQAENLGQTLAALAKFPAEVLLFESRVTPNPAEAVSEILRKSSNVKIIVVTGDLDEATTVDYFRRGVRGIINRNIAPDLLVRCIRKVQGGEMWLDNQGVSWVIEAYRSQATSLTAARPKNRLTDKEMLIVSCVAQGMKNKDIAREIGTTEQVIKNYLRRVYDKLGVSDRLELALYCVHHRLLENASAIQKTDGQADVATATPVSSLPN
ncbi:MAG TPA: response regulator transcription factor [Terriglobales bacterium]|nr:response regulator transcription factor [Terriglobales bacterium]